MAGHRQAVSPGCTIGKDALRDIGGQTYLKGDIRNDFTIDSGLVLNETATNPDTAKLKCRLHADLRWQHTKKPDIFERKSPIPRRKLFHPTPSLILTAMNAKRFRSAIRIESSQMF
jgi:hypothetical protein